MSDTMKMINNFEEYMDSEEGQKTLNEMAEQLDNEEKLSLDLEQKSKLTYKDGQKVLMGDIFIDVDEPNIFIYVYKINEDNTINACFHCTIALKANHWTFNSENHILIERNGKLNNPLDNLFDNMNMSEEDLDELFCNVCDYEKTLCKCVKTL
jgi:hypothetical protein